MIEVITDMGRIIMVFMKASSLTGNARIVIGASGLA
jgi:hypothetical protein